jgi:hypothetical protein
MRHVLVLILVVHSSFSARRIGTFLHKRPEVKFDINFINVSWDVSLFDKGTKEKPVEVIPEVKFHCMKQLKQFIVSKLILKY